MVLLLLIIVLYNDFSIIVIILWNISVAERNTKTVSF